VGQRRVHHNEMRYEYDLYFEGQSEAWRHFFLLKVETQLLSKKHKFTFIAWDDLSSEAEKFRRSVYDVMISYRSKDGAFVDLLQAYLQKCGILCWRDRRMEVGSNWSEDITFAVRNSGCVVSMLSEPYIASSLCTKEVRMGRAVNRVVLPVILPQTENKNPKLVSEHYKGEGPPHTLSAELREVTLIDFRGLSGGTDPTNLESFESKYAVPLQNLLAQVRNIQRENVVWNVSGYWSLLVSRTSSTGIPDIKDSQECTLFLIHKKNVISGYALFWKQGKALPIDPVGSSVTGSMINVIFRSKGLKYDVRAQLSMQGDSFQGLIFSNHTHDSRGTCSGNKLPYHPSYQNRRIFTDEDWVEDVLSCFYSTILCGDYHSYKMLWRHDLDPHKSNMLTLEKFAVLSNELRSNYGYFAFATFLKVDRNIVTSTKYEFEAFFNLKRGLKGRFSFDIKHKITSADEGDEEQNKPHEKKGFFSNIASSVANSSIVRNAEDRMSSGLDEMKKLLDEFEDLKEFIFTGASIELASEDKDKITLVQLNIAPPSKEIFLEAPTRVQEKPTIAGSTKETLSSLKTSMVGMISKNEKEASPAPAPQAAPARVEEKPKEDKMGALKDKMSGLKDKMPKFGFGKKS
jgi:hypothetical protein